MSNITDLTTIPVYDYVDDDDMDFKLAHTNVYTVLFAIFSILSIITNCTSIYVMRRRNYRTFQKTCIISLAISDILSTFAITTTNVATINAKDLHWPLGKFLCSFLPVTQTTGILASSIALMIIAIDRYRNVVYALNDKWNPNLLFCLIALTWLWLISFGMSYPMMNFYIYLDDELPLPICFMAATKKTLFNYYIIVLVVVFLPLFIVFLWCYSSVAVLVWKHRKPKTYKNSTQEASSSVTEPRTIKLPKTQNDIRVERKIRTCKILIALMVVFICCRLPYFVIQVLRSLETPLSHLVVFWDYILSFLVLQIVNCFLNPLLYTFLNSTLRVLGRIHSVVLELWCFGKSEIEGFDTENPFVIRDVEQRRNTRVRFETEKRF